MIRWLIIVFIQVACLMLIIMQQENLIRIENKPCETSTLKLDVSELVSKELKNAKR